MILAAPNLRVKESSDPKVRGQEVSQAAEDQSGCEETNGFSENAYPSSSCQLFMFMMYIHSLSCPHSLVRYRDNRLITRSALPAQSSLWPILGDSLPGSRSDSNGFSALPLPLSPAGSSRSYNLGESLGDLERIGAVVSPGSSGRSTPSPSCGPAVNGLRGRPSVALGMCSVSCGTSHSSLFALAYIGLLPPS